MTVRSPIPVKPRGRLAVGMDITKNLADLFTPTKQDPDQADEEIKIDDEPVQQEPHQRKISFRSLKREVSAQLQDLDLSDSEKDNTSSEEGEDRPGKMALLQEGEGTEDRENDILGG